MWSRRDFVKLLGAVTGVAALPPAAAARVDPPPPEPDLHPLVRTVLAIKARGGSHDDKIAALNGLRLASDAPGVMALFRHPETCAWLREEMTWLARALSGPDRLVVKKRIGLIT
jgi:hypothetical protein